MSTIKTAFERAAVARTAVADTVRTAHEEGLSARQIADQAGVSRGAIAAILHGRRALPPVIYLRGRGAPAEDWADLEKLLGGHHITHDRTQAWHLARGGHLVVLCDITPVEAGTVRVGVVEAKYDTDADLFEDALALPMVAGGVVPRPTRQVAVDGCEMPQARLDVAAVAALALTHTAQDW